MDAIACRKIAVATLEVSVTRMLNIFFLITCFAGPLSLTAYADDSAYFGDGADVYPLQSESIQLVAETIVITDRYGAKPTVEGRRFLIEVDMTFKNHGPDTTVQFGFPVLFWDNNADGEGKVDLSTDFRTWVNEVEVKTVKKKGVPNPVKFYHFADAVFAYPVTFQRNEVKNIKHRYTVGGTFDSSGGWEVAYVLRTGALWKGVIEDFELVYKTPASIAPETLGPMPREQKVEVVGDAIVFRWEMKNFKPKNDFRMLGAKKGHYLNSSTTDEIIKNKSWKAYANSSAALRYMKNRVFAECGYPFRNPFVRAQFYCPGSPYKEDRSYSDKKIPKDHMDFINLLQKREDEQARKESW
jgi:hypothetical protein